MFLRNYRLWRDCAQQCGTYSTASDIAQVVHRSAVEQVVMNTSGCTVSKTRAVIVEPCHEKASFVAMTSLAQLQRLYSDYQLASEVISQYKLL